MNDNNAIKIVSKLLKEGKVGYDPHKKEIVWIYYPKIFKELMKRTVESK